MKKTLIFLLAAIISCTAFADDEDYNNRNISGMDFSDKSLKNSMWEYSTAVKTKFTNATLTNANFYYADLTNADFSNAILDNVRFRGATLNNTIFNNAYINNANFRYTTSNGFTCTQLYSTKSYKDFDLSGIRMPYCNLSGWIFSRINLSNSELRNTDLSNAQFGDANLTGANLEGAVINGATFKDVIGFTASQLSTTASFKNKDLSDIALDVDISSLDVTDFNITGTNFSGTNLRKEQLYSTANYKNKNLRGVGFYTGDYSGWNFVGQNLQNTSWKKSNFDKADVSFADLRGASCTTSDSTGTFITKNTIMADGVIKDLSMKSSGDSFAIRKYDPREYAPESVPAKISEDAMISGGAKLTLEQGAFFEVANGKTLTVVSDGLIQIDTDLSGSTIFNVNSNSGLVFEDGAVLTVNIIDDIITSDVYTFAVISFGDDSRIAGLNNFVKDETLFLTVNGEKFNGAWDYAIKANELSISINVPEPATYAAIFGALALAFAAYRRRK